MKKTNSIKRDLTRRPTHPSAVVREDVLPQLQLTQAEFAQRLGVSRLTVSEVLHEKRSVSVDLAMRIGRLLGNGSGLWLRVQQAFDIWEWKIVANKAIFSQCGSRRESKENLAAVPTL